MLRHLRVLGLSLLALSACADTHELREPSLISGSWEQHFEQSPELPTLVVLTVDDTPGADAQLYRDAIVEPLRASLTRLQRHAESHDPARWSPVNWQLVLVLPSAEGSARFIGSNSNPALAYRTNDSTTAAAEALADVVAAEVAAHIATADAAYRPLQASESAMRLLRGERSPDDEAEQQLAEATWSDQQRNIQLLIASSRDDESPEPIVSYSLAAGIKHDGVMAITTVMPSLEPCDGQQGVATRLEQWSESSHATPLRFPCDSWQLEQGVLGVGHDEGVRSWCSSVPFATRDNGQVDCRIMVTLAGDAPCDSDRGWVDPMNASGERQPEFIEEGSSTRRVCEVMQLNEASLSACQSTSECEGCTPGFCQAQTQNAIAPEGVPLDQCTLGEIPSQLRFIGGALPDGSARLSIVCALAER